MWTREITSTAGSPDREFSVSVLAEPIQRIKAVSKYSRSVAMTRV
jgi:hypothetical protein